MGRQRVITLYESLRDAEQGDISWTTEQKVSLVEKLNELGSFHKRINIEVGMPGANEKDREVFDRLKEMEFDHLNIYAFSGTIHKDNTVETDEVFQQVLNSWVPNVTIVGKSCGDHVKRGLGATYTRNLELITESVLALKGAGKNVNFDVEHAFDGYKFNKDYFFQTLKAAVDAGADCLTLCDTKGGSKPNHVGKVIKEVIEYFYGKVPVAVHCHNDRGKAVANSEAAVDAGAVEVQGTFLYDSTGERCANADLACITGNLIEDDESDYVVLPNKRFEKLTSIVRAMEVIAGVEHDPSRPYVGRNAFAHKGGYHQADVKKHPDLYEHVDPAKYGNRRRFIVSDLGGRSGLRYIFEELKLPEPSRSVFDKLAEKIKSNGMERELMQKTDDSLALFLLTEGGFISNPFVVKYRRIIDEERVGNGDQYKNVDAVVRIEGMEPGIGYGVGPVNALNNAIKASLATSKDKAIRNLDELHLKGFYVKTMNGDQGTAATVKVEGVFDYRGRTIHTSCVHDNITKASERVIVDALKVALIPS
ncbi:MAG: hypothetical protein KJ922_01315, partial [Nanoarchaeota archaeon]|nr:hypothetical protein [Nanoarchaeota archaeon]MBU1703983.1 hypothetical protein [Nanoarchaeota archaeon]